MSFFDKFSISSLVAKNREESNQDSPDFDNPEVFEMFNRFY